VTVFFFFCGGWGVIFERFFSKQGFFEGKVKECFLIGCFWTVCSVLNGFGFQMDSFKYLFVINAQKKRNIQYTCQKRIGTWLQET
jgi:hypothetical protein